MKPKSILKLESDFNMVFKELKDDNEYSIFEHVHSFKANNKGEIVELNISEMKTNNFLFVKRFKESLRCLDISNNYINDTSFLNRLEVLKCLSLRSTRLKSIHCIERLTNLEYLDLRFNKIENVNNIDHLNKVGTTITYLKKLTKLKFLDIRDNNISTLDVDFLVTLRDLIITDNINYKGFYNDFSIDPSLMEILKNDNVTEREGQLDSYIERKNLSGSKLIKRVKLILLGSTQAGKTTLADILTQENKAEIGTTHGVNFFNFVIDDIEIKGYDFGGQDYYHNTHYTFFDDRALYILVWGNGQENKLSFNTKQEMIFPLEYWLASLERFQKPELNNRSFQNNPDYNLKIHVIQNYKDSGNKKFINQNNLKRNFKYIDDFKDNCFLFPKHIKDIQDWFDKTVRKFVRETEILVIDDDVANSFLNSDNQERVVLKFDDIRKLQKRINNYQNEEIANLLKSLHRVLACFYLEIDDELELLFTPNALRSIKNKVIINIEEFTKWIYLILNKEILLIKKDGYFSKRDAIKWLENNPNAVKEIDYVLAFMIKQKLIFKIKSSSNKFFAPNYLNNKLSQAEINYLNLFEKPLVKFELTAFFHTSILSDIISTFYNQLVKKNIKGNLEYLLWKNRVILYEGNSQNNEKYLYIHFDIIPNQMPTISISKLNNKVSDSFFLEVMCFIEDKIKTLKYVKYIRTPKENYIPESILNKDIVSEDNEKSEEFVYKDKIYHKSDFILFLTEEEKLKFPMKKVFISYSHTDSAMMKELTKFLKGLERNGKIEKWTDLELESGVEVKKEILSKLDEADIVILLISQDFIASDFIYDNELPIAMRKKINGKGVVIPVYLSESTIFDLELDIEDVSTKTLTKIKMGNYYFIPQDDKNNLKPIEEWDYPAKAWKKVYDEINKNL